MNGVGIGTSIGLGAIIGLGLVAPGCELIEYVATFAFFGGVGAVVFALYHFAFNWNRPVR